MKRLLGTLFVLLLVASLGLVTTGCEKEQGPAEKLGESIDDAVDEVKDGAEDVVDEIKDKADDVKDEVEDGVEEVKDAVDGDGGE